jgi:hypothetical protein
MATLEEYVQVMRDIRENPETLGYTPSMATVVVEQYEKRISKALLGMLDRILPVLGEEHIDDDRRSIDHEMLKQAIDRMTSRQEPEMEPHAGSLTTVLDLVVSDGARTICVDDAAHGSIEHGLVRWISQQDGDVVVVAPNDRICAQVHARLEQFSGGRTYADRMLILVPPGIRDRMTEHDMRVGKVKTLVLLERHPVQDAFMFEFAERVRKGNPDVVVIYERGSGYDRDMIGIDMLLRRTTNGVEAESVLPRMPRL